MKTRAQKAMGLETLFFDDNIKLEDMNQLVKEAHFSINFDMNLFILL